MSIEAGDKLDMDYINSLGQLYASTGHDWYWPVIDIDVQTGLTRIDVCGMSETKHFHDIRKFRDDSGTEYELEDFYADAERATPQNKE